MKIETHIALKTSFYYESITPITFISKFKANFEKKTKKKKKKKGSVTIVENCTAIGES